MKIGELCLCTHPSQKVAVKPKVQLVQCANIFGRTGIDGVEGGVVGQGDGQLLPQ